MKKRKHEDRHLAALTTPKCTAYIYTDVLHVPLDHVSENQQENKHNTANTETVTVNNTQNSFCIF